MTQKDVAKFSREFARQQCTLKYGHEINWIITAVDRDAAFYEEFLHNLLKTHHIVPRSNVRHVINETLENNKKENQSSMFYACQEGKLIALEYIFSEDYPNLSTLNNKI